MHAADVDDPIPEVDPAVALYRCGFSVAAIAGPTGRGVKSVRRVLVDSGLQLRPPGAPAGELSAHSRVVLADLVRSRVGRHPTRLEAQTARRAAADMVGEGRTRRDRSGTSGGAWVLSTPGTSSIEAGTATRTPPRRPSERPARRSGGHDPESAAQTGPASTVGRPHRCWDRPAHPGARPAGRADIDDRRPGGAGNRPRSRLRPRRTPGGADSRRTRRHGAGVSDGRQRIEFCPAPQGGPAQLHGPGVADGDDDPVGVGQQSSGVGSANAPIATGSLTGVRVSRSVRTVRRAAATRVVGCAGCGRRTARARTCWGRRTTGRPAASACRARSGSGRAWSPASRQVRTVGRGDQGLLHLGYLSPIDYEAHLSAETAT